MTCVFITGTDTDVGKTFVSRLLANGLLRKGLKVGYWKPVQTGLPSRDKYEIGTLASDNLIISESAYEFAPAASPDQAHGTATPVSLEVLQKHFQSLPLRDIWIIEGAGGLIVPLNEKNETWVHFCKELYIPALVVARSGLGTLNHSSLTLEAMKSAQVDTLGLVLNGADHQANVHSLARMWPSVALTTVPLVHQNVAADSASDTLATWFLNELEKRKPAANNDVTTQQDDQYIWHPYTQHASAPKSFVAKAAKGVWLYDDQGKKYFDATSSWWVNTIGHGRAEIRNAIAEQQQKLDHVLFAGVTHEPATHLAKKIIEFSENKFARVFYSDNGSTAVEVALKMAWQYWFNKGESRRKEIITFKESYHGDTFGVMAVSRNQFHNKPFGELFFPSHQIAPVTSHKSRLCERGPEQANEGIEQFTKFLGQHAGDCAALLIEPLVQGAGGMLMHDPHWLKSILQMARDAGLLVIFDEVFTGMGRVGASFAFNRIGFTPDVLCLAKGLTGGTLPLAVTLANDRVFKGFLDQSKEKALLHGHSYTGNPISCAAALATLAIYENENLVEHSETIESMFQDWIKTRYKSRIENARALGSILAFELPQSTGADYFANQGQKFAEDAKALGVFLRPLGNTLYVVPPLVTTKDELNFVLDRLSLLLAKL